MGPTRLDQDDQRRIEQVLGYLNFSSGAPDPGFQQNLNHLFGRIESGVLAAGPMGEEPKGDAEGATTASRLAALLHEQLGELQRTKPAFADTTQAEAVLRAVFDWVLPAYRSFHRDLLFHQSEKSLWQPFFLVRVCEVVLALLSESAEVLDDADGLSREAVRRLNDFIGYRPVAVLETEQKIEPYAHEWVRPIPIYIRRAGVAVGKYHDLVERTLEILRETDADLLEEAWFDLDLLDELAIDPRAYDFDHPANGRPNYVFGQWDPHHLDNQGRFRRFVVRQITIDALVDYGEQCEPSQRDEAVFEAAVVLAGVMLMASGITGRSPETHDSSVSLRTLVRHIAAYRDVFYERWLRRLDGPMGERLRREAKTLKQPLARVRGFLNQALARRRAAQMEHVALARLFARMGYPDAARRQAVVVPAASARMGCEIDCRLTTACHRTDRGELEQAAEELRAVEDWLHRAIECGAIVDPWNILGFQGNFSLFHALEDSVPDHRIPDLIERMDRIFSALGRLGGEAAAAGNEALRHSVFEQFENLAQWWDQFASTEVDSLPKVSGQESYESAVRVADALTQWQQAGSAAGDIAFWRDQVERFQSARAYAPVVDALLNQGDQVASMALLMQWLSQADEAGLDAGETSFHVLAVRWLRETNPRSADDDQWRLICRFFDLFEANVGEYWHVPEFLFARDANGPAIEAPEEGIADSVGVEDDEDSGLFGAAYENMVYMDSAADGHEGELLEGGGDGTVFELDQEARRLNDRLALLAAVATLWKLASRKAAVMPASKDAAVARQRDETLGGWLAQAQVNKRQLLRLLKDVSTYRITPPRGTHASMVEYDRRRRIQQMLLERTIAAYVETSVAERTILGAMNRPEEANAQLPEWAVLTVEGLRCAFAHDVQGVRRRLPRLREALREQPLLYIPLSHRGDPLKVAQALDIQRVLADLLRGLPRLGLLHETCEIVDTVQAMEIEHPVGPGAVTQFDRLFQAGYQAMVESLVRAAEAWEARPRRRPPRTSIDATLVDWIESLTAMLLNRWLHHSRLLRLSVLEPLTDPRRWRRVKRFIRRYGHDLFTQAFFNPGSLRAILDSGVAAYLQQLDECTRGDERPRLLDELGSRISLDEAVEHLRLIIEAVIENYECYRDYNATTTQSDRGEMLYVLLDFLRLKVGYERLAWNLRPVMLAHEVLVRRKRDEAAELWRRVIAERTAEMADHYLAKYAKLVEQSGMRLPTVGDLLAERFVRPLALDRIRSLIEPAIEEARRGEPPKSFELLEQELDEFTRTPTGSGLDLPDWLEVLESEVDQAQGPRRLRVQSARVSTALEWTPISPKEVRRQIERIRQMEEEDEA